MRMLGTILTGDIAALVAEFGGAEILTEPPRDFGLPAVRALRLQDPRLRRGRHHRASGAARGSGAA